METSCFIEHKGKSIYQMDCSNCLPSDVLGIIDECARVVQSQPRKSVRTLIIAGGGRFELETISRLKNLAKDNEPFVLKSAVVGITGLQQVVIMTVSKFSKREFNLFDTVEEAKDFLVAD